MPRLLPLILMFALLLGLGGAGAQGYGFSPTVLGIAPTGNLSTQTTMLNAGQTPATFRVVPVLWRMEGGQSVLSETRDLLVNPASFTLAPGASQVIRVGLRKKPGDTELTYRLLVQEVPGESTATTQTPLGDGRSLNMQLALSFSLPVYVTPPGAQAQVTATLSRDGNDLIVHLRNSGRRRATYGNLLAGRAGEPLAVPSFAVLAGAEYTLRLPGLGAGTGPLTLSYRDADGREVRETLALP